MGSNSCQLSVFSCQFGTQSSESTPGILHHDQALGAGLCTPNCELPTSNREPKGFSLVEMMLALALGSIVLGALLTGLHQTQIWAGNLSRLALRDSNLHLAQLLLSRLISSAGSNLRPSGAPGVEIQADQLMLRADLTGTAEGFPDGSLDDPFESLTVRQRDGRLQLRSGNGTFQSLLEPLESFEAQWQTPRLLRLRLVAPTDGELAAIRQSLSESLELWHSLPNLRPNLFAEED